MMTKNAFSNQAQWYAQYRPHYSPELFDFILSHVIGRGKAWDCGTGSGQVARVLANEFDIVEGTDISVEQLEQAVKKPNINYTHTPAENTTFENNSFDLITVAQAIHWFDFDAFYEEARRTSKEAALLAVIGYGRIRVNKEVDKIIEALYDKLFSRYFSENRKYVESHYQNIPFPFGEIPSPAFNTVLHWDLEKIAGYFKSWSPTAKYLNDHGKDPTLEAVEQLSARWSGKIEVSFPVFVRLGRLH